MRILKVSIVLMLAGFFGVAAMAPRAEASAILKKPLVHIGKKKRQRKAQQAVSPDDSIHAFTTPSIPSILTAKPQDAQISSCIASVCGPASQAPGEMNIYISRIAESSSFTSLWNGTLEPSVQRALVQGQLADLQIAERMRTLLKSGQRPRPGHPMQAYITLRLLTLLYLDDNHLQSLLSANQATQGISFDDSKIARYMKNIPDEKTRTAVGLIIEKMFKPALALQTDSSNVLPDRLKILFPTATPSAALKTDAQQLLSKLTGLKSVMGDMLENFLLDENELPVLKKAAAGQDLSAVESDSYVSVAESIEQVSNMMEADVFGALLQVNLMGDTQFDQIANSGIMDLLVSALGTRDAGKRLQSVSKSCRMDLNFVANSALAPSDYQNLKNIISDVKTAGKTVVGRFVGTASLKAAQAAIDAADFVMPETPADQLTRFKNRITSDLARSQRAIALLAHPNDDTDQMLLWSIPFFVVQKQNLINVPSGSTVSHAFANASAFSGDDDLTPSDDEPIAKYCDTLPTTFTDHTLTAEGRISLSWATAAYPGVGTSVVAHELGHVVSYTCVNSA